jgi:hypothetical protein
MGITCRVEISKYVEFLANNKSGSNWACNISLKNILK